MVPHLLSIFTGWIGPLIIYLVEKDKNPYVRHHAAEALNFQITIAIISFGLAIIAIPLIFLFVGIFVFVLIAIVGLVALIFEIMATCEASKGRFYRYPVCFRFVK